MNGKNCLLIALVSIVLIVLVIIIEKNRVDKNDRNNMINGNNVNNILENFEDNSESQDNLDEMKKYMKIHGLYPMNKGTDMSKYVLKSSVEKSKRCPDMSRYIPKSAVPRQVKCPQINRDDWVRKSELPPNWNKECPAHPDLTNYVLKSTIPPTQKCPPCVCPKIKVNAGLCREPNKEDCIKSGALDDACPKPEPCPVPKCPENKPCPVPKDPICPKCPTPPELGKCPDPERCPPAKNCPKCYSVKYVKVPVVKSEPPQKPAKDTIFPQNFIETKLLRQQEPRQPRQPRILSLNSDENNISQLRNELKKEIMDEINTDLAPSISYKNNIENMSNTSIMTEENMFPSYTEEIEDNNNKDIVTDLKNTVEQKKKCNKVSFNNMFKKFGVLGFNNNIK